MRARVLIPCVCIFAFALLAAACGGGRETTITVIAVNDVHGGIDRFPCLATLVEQYRGQGAERVLLIDCGDRWTGNPYVDLTSERGYPIVELENTLGFDLATYGNHEFDFGLEVLAKRVQETEFPYICANLDANGSVLPQPEPYMIFDVDGIKVGFIGLITTARGGYPDGFQHNFGPLKFSHPVATALKYKYLRQDCDVLAAVTHIGYDLDSVLAVQMPELDLIVGGHSHTVAPDNDKIGNAVVTQAGSRLQYANVIELRMKGKKLAGIDTRLVKLDTLPVDPQYVEMIEGYKNRPELNEVVGTLGMDLDKSGVMNLVTDLVRRTTGADMALQNWGGIRVDSLPKGDVRLVDIYTMEPFGNSIHIVRMTPAQIKEIILNKFNSAGKEGHQADLYPSGFTYRVVTDAKGEGTDVAIKTPARIGADGTYKVAMSDYVATAYNFSAAGTGEPTGIMLSKLLIEYFNNNSPVMGNNAMRVTIGQ